MNDPLADRIKEAFCPTCLANRRKDKCGLSKCVFGAPEDMLTASRTLLASQRLTGKQIIERLEADPTGEHFTVQGKSDYLQGFLAAQVHLLGDQDE